MGATPESKKELIAVVDGCRESEQSWKELLLDAKARGLTIDPKLATGDGALGFMQSAAKRWRLLNGFQLLDDVIQGVQFIDGIKHQHDAA